MRTFIAFTKKELYEMAKTYKLFLMGIVFFVLGVTNPLLAKLTPEIMKNYLPEGMVIKIQNPTALDSWAQFFKNVPQMGLLVLLIAFCGIISNEISKGTLTNLLTKGLSRKTVLLSKFTASNIIWAISFWICFLISYGYTKYYWDDSVYNLLFSVSCVWIFGIMLLSLSLLGEVLKSNNYGALMFTGMNVVIMLLLKIIPNALKYNPVSLITSNMELISNSKSPSDFYICLVITGIITIFSLVFALSIFDKKKL